MGANQSCEDYDFNKNKYGMEKDRNNFYVIPDIKYHKSEVLMTTEYILEKMEDDINLLSNNVINSVGHLCLLNDIDIIKSEISNDIFNLYDIFKLLPINYYKFRPSLDLLIGLLYNKIPFIFGINVDENFEKPRNICGNEVYYIENQRNYFSICFTCIGYKDNYFVLKNPWNSGYIKMDMEHVVKYGYDFYIIKK